MKHVFMHGGTFFWPSTAPSNSGFPPGQPYPGFLRDQRRAWKRRDRDRREAIRAAKRQKRAP